MNKLSQTGSLLPFLSLPGPMQMALDVVMLETSLAATPPRPMLRFYNWPGAWLSLGRHQHQWPAHWNVLVQQKKLRMVRRPSGGGAVLHAGGLTYALVWPAAPRQRREAYRQACQWLQQGFSDLGLPLTFGNQAASSAANDCFASATAADLVDGHGHKRIGSAQLWRQGQLLQHGEILLDPPPQLWEDIFQTKPPKVAPASISRAELGDVLVAALGQCWPEMNWQQAQLTTNQWSAVEREAQNYQLLLPLDSSGCSTNPLASIDSTI